MTRFIKSTVVVAALCLVFASAHISSAATAASLAKSTDPRLQTFGEKMATIYGAIVGKLTDQADRIDKTIVVLNDSTDADLSDASDQLRTARIQIKLAQKSVTILGATVADVLKKSDDPRVQLKEIIDQISDVRQKISDANSSLQYTVVLIKQTFGLLDGDSTSTPPFPWPGSTTTATSTVSVLF